MVVVFPYRIGLPAIDQARLVSGFHEFACDLIEEVSNVFVASDHAGALPDWATPDLSALWSVEEPRFIIRS